MLKRFFILFLLCFGFAPSLFAVGGFNLHTPLIVVAQRSLNIDINAVGSPSMVGVWGQKDGGAFTALGSVAQGSSGVVTLNFDNLGMGLTQGQSSVMGASTYHTIYFTKHSLFSPSTPSNIIGQQSVVANHELTVEWDTQSSVNRFVTVADVSFSFSYNGSGWDYSPLLGLPAEPEPEPDGNFFLVDDLFLEEGENILIKKIDPSTGEPVWVWDTPDGTLNGSFPKVTTPEKPLSDGDILQIGNAGSEVEGVLSTGAGGYLLWSGAGTEVNGTSMHTESYTNSDGVVVTRQVLNVSSSTTDSNGTTTNKSTTIDPAKGETKSSTQSTGGGSSGGGSALTQSQLDESLNMPLSGTDSGVADDMASGFDGMFESFSSLGDALLANAEAWKQFSVSGSSMSAPANFVFDLNMGVIGTHHVEFPTSYFSPIRQVVLVLLSVMTLFTCMHIVNWK